MCDGWVDRVDLSVYPDECCYQDLCLGIESPNRRQSRCIECNSDGQARSENEYQPSRYASTHSRLSLTPRKPPRSTNKTILKRSTNTALNDSQRRSARRTLRLLQNPDLGKKVCPTPSHNSHPSFHGRQLVGRRSESLYGAGNGGLSTENNG